jgi:hypothetical protein
MTGKAITRESPKAGLITTTQAVTLVARFRELIISSFFGEDMSGGYRTREM